MAVISTQTHIRKLIAGFLVLLWVTSPPLSESAPLSEELLTAYPGCTNENRFQQQCLPNVSNVEAKLDALNANQAGTNAGMDKDYHTWAGARSRPGDNAPVYWYKSKRHNQSIQYIDNASGARYIITSLSDEHNNKAAIQLIKTVKFGSEAGDVDKIVQQRLLPEHPLIADGYPDVADFNHPGGSQLIGQYLFLALEDFTKPRNNPMTGVWRIDPEQETINFMYGVLMKPEGDVPGDDYHQSTVAVTRLKDKTFLLAACVYKKCDYINFYKSKKTTLVNDPGRTFNDPEFEFIDQWYRHGPGGLPLSGEDNWDDCGPQNMNFVVQDDGTIYLVMFGGEGSELACISGTGYKSHLYGYKLGVDPQYGITLEFKNKVRVLTKIHQCAPALTSEAPTLHGLNFLAGSGLWPRPDGRNTIAFLATEHYDSCKAGKRPVNAKTRWGVSNNWDVEPPITVDHTVVTVAEGELATNSGTFQGGNDVTLSASTGLIVKGTAAATWNWSWPTTDGPDDSQTVTVTSTNNTSGASNSTTFELLVNNVAPTADAGPDQIVECVHGAWINLDATGSSDPGADTLTYAWAFTAVPGSKVPAFDDPGSPTPSFQASELGIYEAMVTVADDDGSSDTDTVMITFEDTTPPVISSFFAIPDRLWPPNHKMVPVEFNVNVTDACDTTPACWIFLIVSNEPQQGLPDSIITGDLTANLRAERLGKGSGRVYTTSVECRDSAGNSSTDTTDVIVPHDLGKRAVKQKKR